MTHPQCKRSRIKDSSRKEVVRIKIVREEISSLKETNRINKISRRGRAIPVKTKVRIIWSTISSNKMLRGITTMVGRVQCQLRIPSVIGRDRTQTLCKYLHLSSVLKQQDQLS